MKKLSLLLILSLIVFCSFGQSKYMITRHFPIEGDGGWDYLVVDDSSHQLFVSHGTVVQVIDLLSAKLLATIPDTKGVHGIALVRGLNKGFISNGKDTSVTVFDTRTFKVIEKLKIHGINPDAIIYDPFSGHIFTFNGRSNNATVIDPVTNKEIGTVPFDGKPEAAVGDGKGKIYVNIEDKSELCVFDAVKLNVLHFWSVAPGEEPSGLAFDAKTQRLFSVCSNKLMVVMNAETVRMVTTVPIGDHVDGAAFDPATKLVYSSNCDGTLTVIKQETADTYKVMENVTTQKGARTIALDLKNHRIYLPTAEYNAAPLPEPGKPQARPSIKPGSFVVLEISPLD